MKGLGALTGLYQSVINAKNYLYDEAYFQAFELPIPVLSIGNITMGGTGKTPLTDFCLKYYLRKRIKTAVVSRNYRAQTQEISKVDPARDDAANYFGDEPTMLAQKNPAVDVFVGPKKFETAQYVTEHRRPQLVIIDDGFQHRKLHRDVDLVILDATESPENYRCLPSGRAREPFKNLRRATAIIITKTNLAPAADVDRLIAKLKSDFAKPIFCFTYALVRLIPHGFAPPKMLTSCQGLRCHLISGIAKPQSFQKGLMDFGLKIERNHTYEDHHVYSPADVEAIIAALKSAGNPEVITTEKDYVKLKTLWPKDTPLWVAPLEVQLLGREDAFYEILDQVLL